MATPIFCECSARFLDWSGPTGSDNFVGCEPTLSVHDLCNLRERFGSPGDLPWGYCGSPLLVEDRLIINPGSPTASIVALHARTGEVKWKCPGEPSSYGSLQLATFGGRQQIIGHDKTTLGGWDPNTGQRLWTVSPPFAGDFNVPTPMMDHQRLLVATENNGTRLFRFAENGLIHQEPVATNKKVRPDMSTGVVVNDRFYCVNNFLYCLDPQDDLKELWRLRDPALGDYAAIFASNDRLLIVGNGTLLLLNADGGNQIVSRLRIFDSNEPVYSHPAIVGRNLYIRGENKLLAIRL